MIPQEETRDELSLGPRALRSLWEFRTGMTGELRIENEGVAERQDQSFDPDEMGRKWNGRGLRTLGKFVNCSHHGGSVHSLLAANRVLGPSSHVSILKLWSRIC